MATQNLSTKKFIVLGIESTAHTFGVGIADNLGNIYVNVNSTYAPSKGGIHPREAAEHHANIAHKLIKQAIKKAGISHDRIDGIAFSRGPGLGPCLRVGATAARTLALLLNKPLISVNHCVAHIEIGRLLTRLEDPLIVFVSGGNTMIITFASGRYRVVGETLDISLGNCLDTFARELNLGFPGVPVVEKLAEEGRKFIMLPYTVKGQDLSYSGLLTAALNIVNLRKAKIEDVSLSLIEISYAMLVEVTERALVYSDKEELLLTGGVARSRKLASMLKMMVEEHGVKFAVVPDEYAGDNGAMIAYTGALKIACGKTIPVENSSILQRWRLDEEEIPWRNY